MTWLTEDNVVDEAKAKIKVLTTAAGSRKYKYPVTDNTRFTDDHANFGDVERAVKDRELANKAILKTLFYASIGVVDPIDGEKDTYYLSKAHNAHYFALHNVIPWTNWIGSLYTRVRQSMRRGEFPKTLSYGPKGKERNHEIGPLAQYKFNAEEVKARFFTHELFEVDSSYLEIVEEEAEFGLQDIVETIDVDQDEKIRSEMEGLYILTGGPGVGKTTVALHRIPYLLNEQNAGVSRSDHYKENNLPKRFSQNNMLVVVWKDHLVPYLTSCLNELLLTDVQVRHIDDWVAEILRPYVHFGLGKGQYRLGKDPAHVGKGKVSATEQDIEAFLLSDHKILESFRVRAKKIQANLNDWLLSLGKPAQKIPDIKHYTADDIAEQHQSVKTLIEKPLKLLSKEVADFKAPWNKLLSTEYARNAQHKEEILSEQRRRKSIEGFKNAGDQLETSINQFFQSELKRIRSNSAVQLLFAFYESSDLLLDDINANHTENNWLKEQKRERVISHVDRYILAWLIHILQKYDSLLERNDRLPTYSHIVVDEAQYYEPICLRLLYELTESPQKSMTIVGDLDQKIDSEGGILTWEEAGFAVPKENLQRLETNYRWSKNIFNFLDSIKNIFSFNITLQPPDRWYSGDGDTPAITSCKSVDVETNHVAQTIANIKNSKQKKNWSIAIVLPTDLTHVEDSAKRYEDLLQSCNIRARWAIGQDIRESDQHVAITNYDSIVGLEFDAVFLPQLNKLKDFSKNLDVQRAFWVAVTRAKKFECLSFATDADDISTTVFQNKNLQDFYQEADCD